MTDKNLATILKRKRKAVLVELLLTAHARLNSLQSNADNYSYCRWTLDGRGPLMDDIYYARKILRQIERRS